MREEERKLLIKKINEQPKGTSIVDIADSLLITDTEDIYFYLESFYECRGEKIGLSKGSVSIKEKNDIVRYINLETSTIVDVKAKDVKAFEESHKVIVIRNSCDRKKIFYKLKEEYFTTVASKSENEAVKLLEKKYSYVRNGKK